MKLAISNQFLLTKDQKTQAFRLNRDHGQDFVVVVVKVQTKQPTELTQPETIGCCTQLFLQTLLLLLLTRHDQTCNCLRICFDFRKDDRCQIQIS
jgi:hypothetical protein